MSKKYVLITTVLCVSVMCKAQDATPPTDTTLWINAPITTKTKHSPRKATLLSVAVPGLGQVYNRDYWKVPVIYGLGAVCFYYIKANDDLYTEFRRAYRQRVLNEQPGAVIQYDAYDINNPEALQKGPFYTKEQLLFQRDSYRRDRDFTVILSCLLYVLNIADAAVFAHLKDFEVNDNMSMQIKPDFKSTNAGSLSAGLAVKITFK